MSEAFQKLSQKLRSLFKVADRQAKVSVATRPLLVRSSEPLPDSPRKSSKAEELRREADPQLSSRKNLVSDRNITEPGESTSGRLPDFSGSWYSSETHAIDPFLGAMGVSWAARKLVAAMPIRNEIRTDIDLKTGMPLLRIRVATPATATTFNCPTDGTPYQYKRMDDGKLETSRSYWEGQRLITTQMVDPTRAVRSERYFDDQGRMVVKNTVCPSECHSMLRIFSKSVSQRKASL
ncbi:hypothetical protein CYMTET_19290 [Cymbomonas tetramitiformis]|uniref:Uncharacterized protein n=1 Tax=Cymbomonas tetramitiformis TaxID=36881 RepID=A0AAE0G6W4_9CHLO|nr:hypothetical protein CYMTET_19290 [Cymbomonas tetramitiformis]